MQRTEAVKGLEALRTKLSERTKDTAAFVYFVGDRDSETQISWCPDCAASDPVIEDAVKSAKPKATATFITCEVGDKLFWKDETNDFRTSEDLKLTSIPTLLRFGTVGASSD
ncbi:thioredoxin domain-containing protein 17-like [Varroa jacobsoni]|uniref:Thioredoxin domain-containing protein 17 n=1 Tax=Varroa destructor TaxID=109461 RepID=A0A7M7JIC9_VARDE|nr:thioredoxin domain-containing protein 17-like [Varroa destructor]XP_022707534.1 thioredoxin domain-containing protein 17-like [Varroa jacobsoni]